MLEPKFLTLPDISNILAQGLNLPIRGMQQTFEIIARSVDLPLPDGPMRRAI